MDTLVDILLLAFLAICAIAILRLRDLFAMAMMFGLFSLISAGLFTTMDAPDVAFTEAAVGAGISTILILATLAQTARRERRQDKRRVLVPLTVVWITGAVLIYGTADLPAFGDPDAPAHNHVAPHYLLESPREIGIPNVVASVLASYRGFDTLGEVVVVFAAVIGVICLIGLRRRPDASSGAPAALSQHDVLKVIGQAGGARHPAVRPVRAVPRRVQPGRRLPGGRDLRRRDHPLRAGVRLDAARHIIPARLLSRLPPLGVLIYGGVGVATIALGGNFLDYNQLGADPPAAQHLGIMLVEIGVGVTVASVMLLIYFSFAERGRGKRPDNGGEAR
jgi:multicomponent Na+:H+ antiporter subunit B